MKKIISIFLMIILVFSTQSFAQNNAQGAVDTGSDINWNKAVMYLGNRNNTLLNMSEDERKAEREYEQALNRAEEIETEGVTREIMGKEVFFEYDVYTKMLMTQQKELVPEQMKLTWEMSRDSWRITRNSLILTLRSLYLGLYSADSDLKLKQDRFELAKNKYSQDKLKLQNGMISELDLAESEYNLLKAEKAAETAQRNYDNMLRSFNSYIGMPLSTEYSNIVYDEKFDENSFKQIDYFVNNANKTRLDIVSIEKQLALMQKKKDIMDKYPLSLNTVAAREDYDNNVADMESTRKRLESTRLNVESEIKNAYVEVSTANKNVVNLKKTLDLQKSNLEKTRKRYELGLISKNLMDQAQTGYDEFENGYKAALFDYNTKLMKLEFAAGIGLAF